MPYKITLSAKTRRTYSITSFAFSFFFLFSCSTSIASSGPSSTTGDWGGYSFSFSEEVAEDGVTVGLGAEEVELGSRRAGVGLGVIQSG